MSSVEQVTYSQKEPTAEKPRILVVSGASINDNYPNGVLTSVKQILAYFAAESYDAQVVSPKTKGMKHSYAGFPITSVRSAKVQEFRAGIGGDNKIPRLLDEYNPDLIYVAAPFDHMTAIAIYKGQERGIPIISNYQTDIPGYVDDQGKHRLDLFRGTAKPNNLGEYAPMVQVARKLAHHVLNKLGLGHRPKKIAAARVADLHNRSTLNLVPSESARKELISYGVDEASIRLWGRGVDIDLYHPRRRDSPAVQTLRQQWLQGRDVPIVGYVGRIAPEKNLEDLAILRDLDIQLVVTGDGPSMPLVKKRLGEGVIFLGNKQGEELANISAAYDISVNPGQRETLGQVVQEAKASGTPPVGPDIGGPLTTIQPGEGLLYDHNSLKDLRQKVELLANDVELRRRLGAQARKSVELLPWDVFGKQLVGHFNEAKKVSRVV